MISVALLLMTATLVSCERAHRPVDGSKVMRPSVDRSIEAAFHIERLKQGDFRCCGQRSVAFGQPFHVWMLIELNPDSLDCLLTALRDDTPTEERYVGILTYLTRTGSRPEYGEHVATIGDFADYALRCIFKTDVGYRSYISASEREAAIRRWENKAHGDNASIPISVVEYEPNSQVYP